MTMEMETSSELVPIGDEELCLHTWKPPSEPRAVVVVYHGFLTHGRYPTVRYAAELLAAEGYAVVGADLPGHGQSPGLRGYLPGADFVVECGVNIAKHALTKFENKRLFVLGSSMGGNIALSVSLKLGDLISGVVLLAPLIKLSIGTLQHSLLQGLSIALSTWEIIPSKTNSNEKQYRDPSKRKECENDELVPNSGRIRVGSALTCVDLAHNIQQSLSDISVPFLVLVADEDCIVDNQGSLDLFEKARSNDKELKRYKALHGLLCEPPPLLDTIHRDILQWIGKRT